MPSFGVELGTTGLKQYGGRIAEEFLRKLEGDRAAKIFTEMSENDSTVGSILFAVEMLLRNVEWRVEPWSDDPAHVEQAEFVDSCLTDMSMTWENTLAEILSFLPFGWSCSEIVYKRRVGPLEKDPRKRSMHSDGRIGWRKLAPRAQDTLDRWEFDPEGGVDGWWQTQEMGPDVFLPIEKILLFRTTSYKGNPEGKSILRRAFVSWYYKKRVIEAEAIGVERDLAGMPIFYLPPDLFDTTDPDKVAAIAEYRHIIENVKNDEQAGLLLPAHYDEAGNQLVKFELAGTGSRRLIDTDTIINRYDRSIAMTVLADFILLGHEKVGSFALSSDKTALFATALGAWLGEIAATFNRHAIPRLYELNGWNPSEAGELVAGDVEKIDIEAFANAVTGLVGAGMITPGSEDDERHARSLLGLPEFIPEAETGLGDPIPEPEPEPDPNLPDPEADPDEDEIQ